MISKKGSCFSFCKDWVLLTPKSHYKDVNVLRLYDRRLHDAARQAYKIAFRCNEEILSNLDTVIVVNFWDSILEFFVSDSGKLLLWYRNPNINMEFLFSLTEGKFYTRHHYEDVVSEQPLDGYFYQNIN